MDKTTHEMGRMRRRAEVALAGAALAVGIFGSMAMASPAQAQAAAAAASGMAAASSASEAADAGVSSESGGPVEVSTAVELESYELSLPSSYRIVYELTDADGNVSYLERTVSASGDVFYADDEGCALFLRQGDAYARYEGELPSGSAPSGSEGADELVRVSEGLVSAEAVSRQTQEFDYVAGAFEYVTDKAEYVGADELLGRDCSVWQVKTGMLGYTQTMRFWLDDETGALLARSGEGDLFGFDLGQNDSVRCVAFETGADAEPPLQVAGDAA